MLMICVRRLKQAERAGNLDEALRLTAELTAIAACAVEEGVACAGALALMRFALRYTI